MTEKTIINRLLFLILIPISVLNIVIAGIILLPFWVITGKIIYETKMVKGFNTWHNKLH